MRLARVLLYLMAVVFLGLGAMSLVAPTNLTSLVEVAMPTPVAVMEIRGVYGGFFLGTGFCFLLFARRDAWLRPGLVAQACVFGGFVVGRTFGVVLGGAPNLFIAILFAGEIVGMVLSLVALRRINDSLV